MNKPVTSWKKTLSHLGYRVNWKEVFRSKGRALNARHEKLAKSRLQVESLEERQMLSTVTDYSPESHQLTLTGTDDDNSIFVTVSIDGIVEVNGQAAVFEVDGQATSVDAADVESILVYGSGGNDLIDLSGVLESDFTSLPDVGGLAIEGGDGNDSIIGSAFADDLRGGLGDDAIYGRRGDDVISGGVGNDFLVGGDGTVGDINRDGVVNFSDIATFTNVLSSGFFQFEADVDGDRQVNFGDIPAFIDLLQNSEENDFPSVGTGDDTIFGDSGDDIAYGGDGNDTLYGGIGEDSISGDAGNDKIYGNDGEDYIQNGTGQDTIFDRSVENTIVVDLPKYSVSVLENETTRATIVFDGLDPEQVYGLQVDRGDGSTPELFLDVFFAVASEDQSDDAEPPSVRFGHTVDFLYPDDGDFIATIDLLDETGEILQTKQIDFFVVDVVAEIAELDGLGKQFRGESYSFGKGETNESQLYEGQESSFSVTLRDPSPEDTFTVALNLGDGSDSVDLVQEETFQFSDETYTTFVSSTPLQYADDGLYGAVLEVIDDHGVVTRYNIAAQVENVAPLISLTSSSASVAVGEQIAIQALAQDVETDYVGQWLIDWGDGSNETLDGSIASASHSYDTPGTRLISVRAIDEDGVTDSQTIVVNVVDPLGTNTSESVADGPSFGLPASVISEAGSNGALAFLFNDAGATGVAPEDISYSVINSNGLAASVELNDLGQATLQWDNPNSFSSFDLTVSATNGLTGELLAETVVAVTAIENADSFNERLNDYVSVVSRQRDAISEGLDGAGSALVLGSQSSSNNSVSTSDGSNNSDSVIGSFGQSQSLSEDYGNQYDGTHTTSGDGETASGGSVEAISGFLQNLPDLDQPPVDFSSDAEIESFGQIIDDSLPEDGDSSWQNYTIGDLGASTPPRFSVTSESLEGGGNLIFVEQVQIDRSVAATTYSSVLGRHLFYNNSAFDSVSDSDAIATDRAALLEGQQASSSNLSSYDKGINGIIIDLDGIAGDVSASDFEFAVGNDNDPSAWQVAPAPASVTSELLGNGIRRVTIVFADSAISNQWLQVRVLANQNTLLEQDDIFYFGHSLGDTLTEANNAIVDSRDADTIASNFTVSADGFTDNAAPTVNNKYDINRDGVVDSLDQQIAETNVVDIQLGFVGLLDLTDVESSKGTSVGTQTGQRETFTTTVSRDAFIGSDAQLQTLQTAGTLDGIGTASLFTVKTENTFWYQTNDDNTQLSTGANFNVVTHRASAISGQGDVEELGAPSGGSSDSENQDTGTDSDSTAAASDAATPIRTWSLQNSERTEVSSSRSNIILRDSGGNLVSRTTSESTRSATSSSDDGDSQTDSYTDEDNYDHETTSSTSDWNDETSYNRTVTVTYDPVTGERTTHIEVSESGSYDYSASGEANSNTSETTNDDPILVQSLTDSANNSETDAPDGDGGGGVPYDQPQDPSQDPIINTPGEITGVSVSSTVTNSSRGQQSVSGSGNYSSHFTATIAPGSFTAALDFSGNQNSNGSISGSGEGSSESDFEMTGDGITISGESSADVTVGGSGSGASQSSASVNLAANGASTSDYDTSGSVGLDSGVTNLSSDGNASITTGSSSEASFEGGSGTFSNNASANSDGGSRLQGPASSNLRLQISPISTNGTLASNAGIQSQGSSGGSSSHSSSLDFEGSGTDDEGNEVTFVNNSSSSSDASSSSRTTGSNSNNLNVTGSVGASPESLTFQANQNTSSTGRVAESNSGGESESSNFTSTSVEYANGDSYFSSTEITTNGGGEGTGGGGGSNNGSTSASRGSLNSNNDTSSDSNGRYESDSTTTTTTETSVNTSSEYGHPDFSPTGTRTTSYESNSSTTTTGEGTGNSNSNSSGDTTTSVRDQLAGGNQTPGSGYETEYGNRLVSFSGSTEYFANGTSRSNSDTPESTSSSTYTTTDSGDLGSFQTTVKDSSSNAGSGSTSTQSGNVTTNERFSEDGFYSTHDGSSEYRTVTNERSTNPSEILSSSESDDGSGNLSSVSAKIAAGDHNSSSSSESTVNATYEGYGQRTTWGHDGSLETSTVGSGSINSTNSGDDEDSIAITRSNHTSYENSSGHGHDNRDSEESSQSSGNWELTEDIELSADGVSIELGGGYDTTGQFNSNGSYDVYSFREGDGARGQYTLTLRDNGTFSSEGNFSGEGSRSGSIDFDGQETTSNVETTSSSEASSSAEGDFNASRDSVWDSDNYDRQSSTALYTGSDRQIRNADGTASSSGDHSTDYTYNINQGKSGRQPYSHSISRTYGSDYDHDNASAEMTSWGYSPEPLGVTPLDEEEDFSWEGTGEFSSGGGETGDEQGSGGGGDGDGGGSGDDGDGSGGGGGDEFAAFVAGDPDTDSDSGGNNSGQSNFEWLMSWFTGTTAQGRSSTNLADKARFALEFSRPDGDRSMSAQTYRNTFRSTPLAEEAAKILAKSAVEHNAGAGFSVAGAGGVVGGISGKIDDAAEAIGKNTSRKLAKAPKITAAAQAKGSKFLNGFKTGTNQQTRQIGKFTEFSTDVAGRNGQSFTRWVKVVDESGRTIRLYHDTFDNTGKFIHRGIKVPGPERHVR